MVTTTQKKTQENHQHHAKADVDVAGIRDRKGTDVGGDDGTNRLGVAIHTAFADVDLPAKSGVAVLDVEP